jgi:hypothetical protein
MTVHVSRVFWTAVAAPFLLHDQSGACNWPAPVQIG